MDSAQHDPFTPSSSARRCLESELTLATAYRILTDAQLRDKPMLNPRECGDQDEPGRMAPSRHPGLALGTMVSPMAPISATHDAKPRDDNGIRHNPPESRARSNVLLTRA